MKHTKNDKHKGVYMPLRCSPELAVRLDRIAAAEGVPRSMLLRQLLEAGLVAKGYAEGNAELSEVVRQAVAAELKPQTDRLAAISAKAAHISAAAFFLNYSAMRELLPEDARQDYDELAAKARRLGAEYLRLSKEKGVDDFLGRGLRSMKTGGEDD